MAEQANSFFLLKDGVYIGRDPARGPWSADHCHGGPVAAILARELEQLLGAEKQLVRLTIDLIRAVPLAGVTISTKITRKGRKVATASATLTDLNGKICANATSMYLAPADVGPVPTAPAILPDFENAKTGQFALMQTRHGLPSFSDFIEIRYPPGEDNLPGPTTLWMKTLPILPDEEPSPFQTACPLADCGNGSGRNTNLDKMGFVNTDLTITLHRPPTSKWLAHSALSHWDPGGLGQAQATLFDRAGVIGTASQTLLLNRV